MALHLLSRLMGIVRWVASTSEMHAMQVSHGAIQFMVYEELKALTAGAGEYAKDTGRSSLSAGQISVIGAASKLAASVVTYPSQVLPPM